MCGMLRSIVFPLYFLLVVAQLSTQLSPTSAQNEQFKSPVILNVERPLVCTTSGESVKISCTLTRIDGVKFKNDWEISWFSDGRKLNESVMVKNDSVFISYLTLDVTWSNERVFMCVGRALEKTTNISWVLNSSLIVRLKPPAIANIIGLRFIEKALGKTVQVFWKPVNYLNSTTYTLKYCIDDTEEILGSAACPHYRSFAGKCLLRHRDYYKVPNTTGFVCKAEFKQTAGIYTVHKLYVATKVAGCEGVSAERRFYLSFWKDPFPDPDITELVMVPYPITNLKVLATKQRIVELSWSDPRFENSREYTVGFKCLKSRNWSRRKHFGITNVTLTSRDIRHYHPYDLCRFCVTAKAYENGVGSEPVCVDIRLHEEVPTGVPTVTCVGHECKTTSDGTKRNVTLTWTLPAEEEWNGVLTKVKIFLRDGRFARSMVMAVTNWSKSETVLTGLATNRSYVVQMVVCNKEGCGGLGNATEISALSADGAFSGGYSGGSIGDNLLVKLVSSIGGPLFILLGVYFAYVTWTWLQMRKDHRASLQPDIFEPISYESVKEPDEDMAEYIVLDWKDQKQQKDSADLRVFYKADREYKSEQQQCV